MRPEIAHAVSASLSVISDASMSDRHIDTTHTLFVTVPAVAAQDVKMVAWHPKGEVLVSCSYDDSIKVWIDCDGEWECAQTLAGPGLGHSSTVWGVAFSRDGSQMVSCSDDQTLRVWACSFDNPGDTLTSCVCV